MAVDPSSPSMTIVTAVPSAIVPRLATFLRRRRHVSGSVKAGGFAATIGFVLVALYGFASLHAAARAFCLSTDARHHIAPRASALRPTSVLSRRQKPRGAFTVVQAGEDVDSEGDADEGDDEEQEVSNPFLEKILEFARLGDVEAAEDTLYELIDTGAAPKRQHFNAVIEACAGSKDLERAERWRFRMEALGVMADISTINSLLTVSLGALDVSSAESWFREAEEAGMVPILETFRIVLQTLGKTGSTELAEVWLEKLMDSGLQPDTGCCNAIVEAFAKKENMKKVEEWIIISERRLGVKLDVETYNTAIAGYTALGNTENAERIFQQMKDRGVKPTVQSYAFLIGDGKTRFSNAVAVARWTEELRGTGMPLDAATYTAIVGAWVSVGDVPQAESWFSEMVDQGEPTSEALALVVDALVLSQSMEGLETAEEWVEQARQLGTQMTPAVYAALTSADVFSGDFEQVEARMQQMEADGLEMNEDSLVALLLAYGNAEPQQTQLAEQVFKQQMLRGKVAATRDVLEALRSAVGGARCLQLRRDLQINTSPDTDSPSRRARKKRKSRQWAQFATHQVKEKTIAWE